MKNNPEIHPGSVLWIHISRIERAVEAATGYNLQAIRSGGKSTDLLFARILFGCELKRLGLGPVKIGGILNRTHAAVLRYEGLCNDEYETSPYFRIMADNVKDLMSNG